MKANQDYALSRLQSTTVRIDAALYLPISEQILGQVRDEARSLEDVLTELTVPEIASLIALQYLPAMKQRPSLTLDRVLIAIINAGNAEVERKGSIAFRADALNILHREKIDAGYQLLADFGIALLGNDALEQRDYLTPAGQWDSSFPERYRTRQRERLRRISVPGAQGTLTAEQSQIFREVKSQTDDHLHVQGYAGTGKSFLIKSLLSMLQPLGCSILILAERQRQLDALLADVGQLRHVHPRRFDTLAGEMAPPDLTDPINRRMARATYSPAPISDDDVVRHLGIQSSGAFSSRDIAKAARSAVAKFCFSGDREMNVAHIPDWCASSLDATTRQLVLHFATELWKAVLQPRSRDFQPPLRGYHKVKWAALKGWQIPARYTHILIDECHDLAKPMLQILDGSSQAVISLGDEYQNLQGRAQVRSNVVRQRATTCSVRSGQSIEQVVNPIIFAHPGSTKFPFHGNPFNKTEITYYDKARIPADPAVILVGNIWALFEWVQRLSTNDAKFELLSNQADLNMFVNDCIELYRHGTRPRHGELFRFSSWEAVKHRHHAIHGLQRIDRMLEKGYDGKDWATTLTKLSRRSATGSAVGLIEDVRNREFDTVMLAPDVIEGSWGTAPGVPAAISSAIYVAVTRARRRLIIPERLRNWIEEISAAPTKARLS
jgi:hypothetical protein